MPHHNDKNGQKARHYKIIATNAKARFNYEIVYTIEAGVALTGSEVKSLRINTAQIRECYVQATKSGDLALVNLHISEYDKAATHQHHQVRRSRRLLLHKREIKKIIDALQKKGMAAVPLKMYFNDKGIVKCHLAVARGKKTVDKRQVIKQREWNISKARLLKQSR